MNFELSITCLAEQKRQQTDILANYNYLHTGNADWASAFMPWNGSTIPYKPVKVQNVRARFRAESGFLDYDGVATNTIGLPDSIATNVLPIVQVRIFSEKKIRG